MSHAPYQIEGLRTWRQSELLLRRRIRDQIVETVQTTLLDLNQMWAFEEVETPPMMPMSRMSAAYDRSDVFVLSDAPGGTEPWALRAETTDGSYEAAVRILRTTRARAPLCVWQMGTSFRRETSDGATAAKLRFNAFTQLEMQCVFAADSTAPIADRVREALVPVVARITGLETRLLLQTERVPAYSMETVDVECRLPDGEWREVASTSRRRDFPEIPGQKPLTVFEVAFGADRMVALAQGGL